jgi:hypothetical protein
MLKIPIFRQNEKIMDNVVTSPTLAFIYSQFRDSLIRLGLAVGFLLILTCYYFRRGIANIVDRKFSYRLFVYISLLTGLF